MQQRHLLLAAKSAAVAFVAEACTYNEFNDSRTQYSLSAASAFSSEALDALMPQNLTEFVSQ